MFLTTKYNTPAGRPSLSRAEKKQSEKRIAALELILQPFDPAARKMVKRVIALESNARDPRVTVCGVSIKQSDITRAIREFAKKVKALEADGKAMQTSNSNLSKRTTILEKKLLRSKASRIRTRGSRDQWRRIAQMAGPDRSEEEKEQMQQTITNLERRVDDLEARLEPVDEAQGHYEEMRMIPVFTDEDRFVSSPVNDTHACTMARKQALADHAQSVMAMAKPPVRLQSLTSIAPQDRTRLSQARQKKRMTG